MKLNRLMVATVFFVASVATERLAAMEAELLSAAESGDSGRLQDILNRTGGAIDINFCYDQGMTSLHYAAEQGNGAIAKILLGAGAGVNIQRNSDGWTPLHVAVANARDKEIKSWTKGPGDPPTTDQLEIIQMLLLDRRTDKDIRDRGGRTPLYVAAWQGRREAAKILLRAGARVDIPDADGLTPIHKAAQRGHDEVARAIIEKAGRANLSARDKNGWTPLHHAAVGDFVGHEYIIRDLVQAGADVNSKDDRYGNTPLHWAKTKDIFNLLMSLGANSGIRNFALQFPSECGLFSSDPLRACPYGSGCSVMDEFHRSTYYHYSASPINLQNGLGRFFMFETREQGTYLHMRDTYAIGLLAQEKQTLSPNQWRVLALCSYDPALDEGLFPFIKLNEDQEDWLAGYLKQNGLRFDVLKISEKSYLEILQEPQPLVKEVCQFGAQCKHLLATKGQHPRGRSVKRRDLDHIRAYSHPGS